MILNAFYVRNFFTHNMMVHMSDNHELFEELIATIEINMKTIKGT